MFFGDHELDKGIDHNKDVEVDKFTVTQDIVTRRSHRKVDLEPGGIKMPQHSLNDQDSSIGDEEYEEEKLYEVPKEMSKKLFFLILFPIKMTLYHLIPNFRHHISLKKLLFAMFFIMGALGLIVYCAMWWMSVVSKAIGLDSEIMGVNFGAPCFSISFIQYIIEIYDRTKDTKGDSGLLSMFVLGIYKLGCCIGFAYVLYCGFNSQQSASAFPNGFQIILAIYAILVAINIFTIILCRMRILKPLWYIYAGITGIFWIITWILCIVIQ